MKIYEKIIDGKQHCKPANKIVIVKDGMQIFNPTEEMIFADGWRVYVTPMHNVTVEEFLNQEKEQMIENIFYYDSSDDVNIFYFGEQKMWLDKATRVGLKLRFDAELSAGKNTTTLWYNGMSFELELSAALHMLNAIELYASACYDKTQAHIASINAIEDLEALKNYDYRTGYPEKLRF